VHTTIGAGSDTAAPRLLRLRGRTLEVLPATLVCALALRGGAVARIAAPRTGEGDIGLSEFCVTPPPRDASCAVARSSEGVRVGSLGAETFGAVTEGEAARWVAAIAALAAV
jgi:hypothetical protein